MFIDFIDIKDYILQFHKRENLYYNEDVKKKNGSGASFTNRICFEGGYIMKKFDKQNKNRELANGIVALCVLLLAVCVISFVIRGTGYIPVNMLS